MNARPVLSTVGLGVVLVGGVMAATNPQPATYHRYATARITRYLQDNVCPDAPQILGNDLRKDCDRLLREQRQELRRAIADATQRTDLGVLSLYQTTLSTHSLLPEEVRGFVPPQLLPTYEFSSVGAFQRFLTYKAKRQ